MGQNINGDMWLWPKFDAYVKKVIKTSKCSFVRLLIRESKVPVLDDKLILAHINSGHDDYPSDHFYLLVDGKLYPVEDYILFEALQQLPDALLKILVLKFWHQDSEKEIAQKMNVTIRSCYTRRKKALALLKSIMEDESNESAEQ